MLESIIASAMDVIITVDDEQNIVLFNHAAEKVFQIECEKVLGTSLDAFLPTRYRDIHREHVRNFGATGETSRSMRSPGRLTAIRASGEEFPIEATISRIVVDGRQFFTVVLRDITERVQAEQARNAFLAMLGHELRNPLQVLTSALYLAQGSAEGIPGLDRPLALLETHLKHMVRLVNDLLDVSRVTRGKLSLQKAEVALEEIVNRSIELSRSSITRKSQDLEYVPPPVSVGLYADTDRLVQAVANLLENASKFSPAGSPVYLIVSLEGPDVLIQVRDEGIGLEQDDIGKIFDPFTQVKPTLDRQDGGLGVGLALSRAVAELHGGTLRVESAGAGLGSTFSIRLPRDIRTDSDGQGE